jgi:hypothetical protein
MFKQLELCIPMQFRLRFEFELGLVANRLLISHHL